MLGLSTGSLVSSLPSTGGITNTLSQISGINQPVYELFNDRGSLGFDGQNGDYMLMSDLSISNAAPALDWDLLGKSNGQIGPQERIELDHIIPLACEETPEQVVLLNHYLNFQPMCAFKNKHIKMECLRHLKKWKEL